MRKIDKGQPLESFTQFIENDKPINWEDFQKRGKTIFEKTRLQILSKEQNYQCGYTELYISEPLKCHIDHYKKKSIYPQLEFEWNNFIVATKDSLFGANYKDSSYKIKKEDYNLILDPTIDNAQEYFLYNSWGEITSNKNLGELEKEKVNKTIEVFNLNHRSLIEYRKKIIQNVLSYKSQLSKSVIEFVLE
ncbi:MAG: TIGR02646 family protein [Ignavibacteriae bacterium]|nr:TIGR02646 family protein [Ignavibacteriota bacterium]